MVGNQGWKGLQTSWVGAGLGEAWVEPDGHRVGVRSLLGWVGSQKPWAPRRVIPAARVGASSRLVSGWLITSLA